MLKIHASCLVVALLVWLMPADVFAMLHPQQGRFMQRDPLGYVDGMSAYEYETSCPMQVRDPWGLWGSDVHHGKTRSWALAAGIPEQASEVIATADESVDNGSPALGELGMAFTGTGPLPVAGDQGWHFNSNKGKPKTTDTRLDYGVALYKGAKEVCSLKGPNANRPNAGELAAKAIGGALHPWQDWWAHGEYGYTLAGQLWSTHNSRSPQVIYGDPSNYPDDPSLDATGTADGRVTSRILLKTRDGYEYAIYTKGQKRINSTKRMTEGVYRDFLRYLRSSVASPQCRCYFGVAP